MFIITIIVDYLHKENAVGVVNSISLTSCVDSAELAILSRIDLSY